MQNAMYPVTQETYILHFFLNVLNAFGYKDSEFVVETLIWEKRVHSSIKGWVVNYVGGAERLLRLIMLQH